MNIMTPGKYFSFIPQMSKHQELLHSPPFLSEDIVTASEWKMIQYRANFVE